MHVGPDCEDEPPVRRGEAASLDSQSPRAPSLFTATQECAAGRERDGMTRRSPTSLICSAFCSSSGIIKGCR